MHILNRLEMKKTMLQASINKIEFDPFDGAKPHPLGWGRKRRSGSTLSKPQPSGWGVEGLTFCI